VNLLVADRPEEFARAVSTLLESAELRHRLGASGRRLYEAEFTWETAWSRLAAAGM
jgi:glycosyltransferase involved in cell wall biosynthesis